MGVGMGERHEAPSEEYSMTSLVLHWWDLGENNEFPVPLLRAFLLPSTHQSHITRQSLHALGRGPLGP